MAIKNKKSNNRGITESILASIEKLIENNVPTNPSKWSYYKSQAKKKFDVYPSAYANAWAAKQYKAAGGGWKKGKSESTNEATPEEEYEFHKKLDTLVHNTFGKRSDEEIDEYDVETIEETRDFIRFMREYKLDVNEAEYQGREVKLGKPMQGDVKKFKVYVKNDKGNVVKVNFGQKGMTIKKDNPGARKSFRARMNCDEPGPRWKARYWSCRKW